MTISEMLGQSAILTLLGMMVVFSFIIIMIISLGLMERLVKALHLDVPKGAGSVPAASAQPAAVLAGTQNSVIAAIAAAIKARG
ncbi:MAG: OadG family protein [Spirochaetaceae bacterium]|jgi:oxaloacetate decarboxylase gamma subunit|nr:OadG family protein [Spirochaetaceae bacterium]